MNQCSKKKLKEGRIAIVALEDEIEKLQKLQHGNVTEMPVKGFELNKDGAIKTNSMKNVSIILKRDPLLAGKFRFNEFTYEIDLTTTLEQLMLEAGPIEDAVYPALLEYIEDKYHVLFPERLIQGALTNVSRINVYNPVLDYFEDCEQTWDGKRRVDELFPRFLGVEHSDLTTLITKLFFTGAVAKAYEPKTKFDYVLDLVGGQGAGKTTLLKRVSNGWYTDNFETFNNKDDYSNMLRALIINDDELTATANSSFESLKKFISSQMFEYRKSYGRNTVRRYKSFVMARTTNELTYLKDRTGERRFLPLLVQQDKQVSSPLSDEFSQAYIDQLWGEVTTYYHDGFRFNLTPEQEKALNQHRLKFMYVDAQEEAIEEFLQSTKRNFVSTEDIAFAIGEQNIVKNTKLAKKIKYVMDNHLGWKKTQKRLGVEVKRGYQRQVSQQN